MNLDLSNLSPPDIILIFSIIFIIVGSFLADFKIIISGVFSFSCGFLVYLVSFLSGMSTRDSIIFGNAYVSIVWPLIYVIVIKISRDESYVLYTGGGIKLENIFKLNKFSSSPAIPDNTLVKPDFESENSELSEEIPNQYNTTNFLVQDTKNPLEEWYWVANGDIKHVVLCLLNSRNNMISVRNFRKYEYDYGVKIQKYVEDCRKFLLDKSWAELFNNNSARLTQEGRDKLNELFWNYLNDDSPSPSNNEYMF